MKLRLTKEEFLHLGHQFSKQEGTAFLYSGGSYASSRFSFLCLFPTEKIVVELDGNNPWSTLKDKLHLSGEQSDLPSWVGYLSYELGAFSDTKTIPFHASPIPLAIFYKPSLILRYDHQGGFAEGDLQEFHKQKFNTSQTFRLKCIQKESEESFIEKIQIAKEKIVDGCIYQVNLSHQLLFEGKICPFSYFEQILLKNPAPFAAFVKTNDFALISSSPERFLKKTGNHLITVPIKGTHPRGTNETEDLLQKNALKNCPKEQAELLMITDLLRNDLGKISIPGSVQVPEHGRLETFENVFHLSSTITSISTLHPLDILKAVFPGGSISGCPKLRALEVIYQLEKRPRHIYTGSIGYLTNSGNFDFNIAIRTCLYKDEILNIQLGAGIVSDSNPKKEYDETLAKGATLIGLIT